MIGMSFVSFPFGSKDGGKSIIFSILPSELDVAFDARSFFLRQVTYDQRKHSHQHPLERDGSLMSSGCLCAGAVKGENFA